MLAALRFIAAVLLLVAVVALIYDATRTLSGPGGIVTTPLIEHWSKLAPGSLKSAQSAVERTTHPLLWDPLLVSLIRLPVWALFGVLGLLLAYAGRRRRRVNIYAN
jgi:hypothetical protein